MAKKKIMVVDDETTLVELITAIFEQEGFDVIGVNSGPECLEKLKEVKPDLIIMDMMMPKMTGTETTEKIRADPKNKDIKIVFLTVSRFSESGKDILKKSNVLDYITKPFDNADLAARVKKLLW